MYQGGAAVEENGLIFWHRGETFDQLPPPVTA